MGINSLIAVQFEVLPKSDKGTIFPKKANTTLFLLQFYNSTI